MASMHLKAVAGGPGHVEVDVDVDSNPNPLRDLMATPMPALDEGALTLSEQPGLGVTPDEDAVRGILPRCYARKARMKRQWSTPAKRQLFERGCITTLGGLTTPRSLTSSIPRSRQ
jgi:hypothetical protein